MITNIIKLKNLLVKGKNLFVIIVGEKGICNMHALKREIMILKDVINFDI